MNRFMMAGAALGAALAAYAEVRIDTAHDRVQTTFAPGFARIGTVAQREAKSTGRSRIALGCEMLPRGYGSFDAFKDYIPPLGVARVRLQAGWAKLEPERGKLDFAWLDRQVDYLLAHGISPILETSYGNTAYSNAGGPSLSDGLPRGEDGRKAWDAFIDRLAEHYRDRVTEWFCWNEPNNDPKLNPPELAADNNIRTARLIRKHNGAAKIGMLTMSWPDVEYARRALEVMKRENALGLFTWVIYHDYSPNPDASAGNVARLDRLARSYAPHLRLFNGESGATSDPHFSSPISSGKWCSELTQAKWNCRRVIADIGRDIDSLVFTIYDPCYDNARRYMAARKIPRYWIRRDEDHFMKRMGLLKCNEAKQVVKVKAAYYAIQNLASIFDSGIRTDKFPVAYRGALLPGSVATYRFRRAGGGERILAYWNCVSHPENDNATSEAVFVADAGCEFAAPVLVDVVTGAIYEVGKSAIGKTRDGKTSYALPIYDAPLLLTEKSLVIRE